MLTRDPESAERKRAVRIFRESAPSRIVDPQTSAIIIVMQRLHAEDISGVALSLGDYVHLCLPMEFEADRACETMIGFKDPRRYEGELLFPERFSREAVDRAGDVLRRARGALVGTPPADDVLLDRIRSRMGHVIEHPGQVNVDVQQGFVVLRGRASIEEIEDLTLQLGAMRGVTGVDNRLIPDAAARP